MNNYYLTLIGNIVIFSVPTTSEMVQPNPPASIPWSHLTKAEKLRMAQAKDQGK